MLSRETRRFCRTQRRVRENRKSLVTPASSTSPQARPRDLSTATTPLYEPYTMAEQADPPAARDDDVPLASSRASPPQRADVLVQNPVLLARVLGFLGSKYAFTLGASCCRIVVWRTVDAMETNARCSDAEQELGARAHEARGVGGAGERAAPAAAAQLLPPRVIVLLPGN